MQPKMGTDGLVDSSKKTLKIENTEKRDNLISIEQKYQKIWEETHIFETNAPSTTEVPLHALSPTELRIQNPKFFGMMAYPYMNGTLHVGHGFTISKVEFATGYERMCGKRALFPMGFHCTGMAIKACADKLEREVEMFGLNFERYKQEDGAGLQGMGSTEQPPGTSGQDVAKFTSKKTKLASKSIQAKYQFQIMLAQGIPREEIHHFADPYHWINVFPAACKSDLVKFGSRIDWRRSFVTTDANPFYDSFVRWQINRLNELGKIKFGKRYTVYSPKDGQACLDHDRSKGEGVNVQEYTVVKMKVTAWAERAKARLDSALPPAANVYFMPATLRPETMYGQTCCFVGQTITYGVYRQAENEYLFLSNRSARNMAFQGIFSEWGHFPKVLELQGAEVVGTLVEAPLSIHTNGVRILPMDMIDESKGTGVVTCVPSDSPDDYAMVLELAKKAEYYGIKKEWVHLEITPIIETPSYGGLTAPTLISQLKISSPKDAKQLAQAKDLAYKEGFYKGKMLIGEFNGLPVQRARELIIQYLVDSNQALKYAEPEGLVISRSGDECVAAHLDQWYLNYGTAENGGDEEWSNQVLKHVNGGLNTFTSEAKHLFESTLGWLSQWACTRSYGLGSKLPWDNNLLVDTLSDSTIYTAYYTVAHYLHSDLFGKQPGLVNISPDQMTDEVWDYVFSRTDAVTSTIHQDILDSMRREFEYFYPVDLRVSGKDLVQNHLTFFLYNHVAMWPEEYWPRGVRANGHLLLNGEKMSKSTGNFLTLSQAVEKFGTDATRLTMADAGDGMEDANFEETVANRSILKLYELKKWCEDVISNAYPVSSADEYIKLRQSNKIDNIDVIQRTGEFGFWDKLFENELNALVQETKVHYDGYLFKSALKSGFYDFTSARDFYRESTKAAGIGMHQELIQRYIEWQALLIAPITPHWAEYIWLELLRKPDTVQHALFPKAGPSDSVLAAVKAYVRSTASTITSAEGAQRKKSDKGKNISFDPRKPWKLFIFFAKAFPAWQERYINLTRDMIEELGHIDIKAVRAKIEKRNMKTAIPFIQDLKNQFDASGNKEVTQTTLPFDESAILREMKSLLIHTFPNCQFIEIVAVEEGSTSGTCVESGEIMHGLPSLSVGAVPGCPTFQFANV